MVHKPVNNVSMWALMMSWLKFLLVCWVHFILSALANSVYHGQCPQETDVRGDMFFAHTKVLGKAAQRWFFHVSHVKTLKAVEIQSSRCALLDINCQKCLQICAFCEHFFHQTPLSRSRHIKLIDLWGLCMFHPIYQTLKLIYVCISECVWVQLFLLTNS